MLNGFGCTLITNSYLLSYHSAGGVGTGGMLVFICHLLVWGSKYISWNLSKGLYLIIEVRYVMFPFSIIGLKYDMHTIRSQKPARDESLKVGKSIKDSAQLKQV